MPEVLLECSSCGAPLPALALACPKCKQLVYSVRLEELARQAQSFEAESNPAEAAKVWRAALALLPPDSKQAEAIRDHIAALGASTRIGEPEKKPTPDWVKRLGPLGLVVAFFLKFKTVLFLILAKGKFLLFGLAKFKTLLTMFASMGLYWTLYGWRFAVGFVLGIYIHEMGHVWMLRHYGLRASAPMFIPGFGAFISLYDSPPNVSIDARIGLAGPLWGSAAALATVLPAMAGYGPVWLAIAQATAYINLFNLTPVWTLDGGRAFRALDYKQRLYIFGLMGLLWFLTQQGIFIILLLGAAYRIFWQKDHAPGPDKGAFAFFAGLLIFLGALLAWLPLR